ncbi:4Fe-4S ferredoxin [Candidatus Magnetomoraceae bacterium gMMP-15]
MKTMRKIIEIDEELCDGCGQCVLACAEGAIQIIDGKAKVISDNLCDGLGACIGECPTGALKVIEREAEEFDVVAVEKHLAEIKEKPLPCECPSTKIQSFTPSISCESANKPASIESQESALSHWPVKIRLIPPTAPFLKGADLLVLADCVPAAFPNLHRDFLKGKVVMMGCPKFDEVDDYIDKFADIFKTADIKSITTLIMDVPCCSGLPAIVKKGLEISGKKIIMKKIVIDSRGNIL